jgi:beta-alanine--pyruvate transaminase
MHTTAVNDLSSYWMPFTANRQFKAAPRLVASGKGMYVTDVNGRQILDAVAGLWCINAGHCHPRIVEAIQKQAGELDFASSFQMGHPKAFEHASRLASVMPGDLNHVFFACSGSEAVDSAMKIALAYHRISGQAARTRFIGRERAYHGVNFGGTSVGGMVNNRKSFGPLLPGVDHLPHTYNAEQQAFSRGEPEWGAHLADSLEQLVALHGADTISAVIVEPVAGATGVLPPPKGYLKRLRNICDTHGILLIFDEVITGFGRLGARFAAEYFDVQPDIMVIAKAMTNAAVPMGAAIVRKGIYDAFMQGPEAGIELAHGYTYSGHPLACAAGLATLDVHQEEELAKRCAATAPIWEKALHSLKGLPYIADIRNIGLLGAIQLEQRPSAPGTRTYDVFLKCFEDGVLTRAAGENLILSPSLIINEEQIDRIVSTVGKALKAVS